MKMLFNCDACQQKYSIVIWKNILPHAGYLCENCWNQVKIRLDNLYKHKTTKLGRVQKLP